MADTLIRVMTVDDHWRVREGLADLLGSQPDMRVVAEAGSLDGALETYARVRPDVVVLDARLGDATGLDGLTTFLARFPGARIIVMTTYALEIRADEARQAGACGFVLKADIRVQLLPLLRSIRRGV